MDLKVLRYIPGATSKRERVGEQSHLQGTQEAFSFKAFLNFQ